MWFLCHKKIGKPLKSITKVLLTFLATSLPPQSFSGFSYLINNPAFMPVRCKDEGMAAFDSFIKILPLQKEQEPILVKYAVLYNENDTTTKSYGTPNIHQNRIRSLLLDRLLK